MRYEIKGDTLPVAVCSLQRGEALYCEAGAMSWMTDGIRMETEGGGIGKVFGRMFSGETLFRNRYTAERDGEIAFASSFPGSIIAVELSAGRTVIAQKRSFLACDSGVDMEIFFQKRLGKGFFGGEGFIMQKFSGNGTVLLEIDGSAVEYLLEAGQRMIVDTGHLAMMDGTCSIDIEMVRGAKNIFLGGEGLFNTYISGPGKIVLQTMPVQKTAMQLYQFMPHPSSN